MSNSKENELKKIDEAFDTIRELQKPLIGDKEFLIFSRMGFGPVYIVTREEFREIYEPPKKKWYHFRRKEK